MFSAFPLLNAENDPHLMMSYSEHIALFGTSADPPSVGHRTILRWLSDRFDRVAVWASDNPFKSHQTPLEHRSAMLELTVQELRRHDGTPCENVEFHGDLSSSRTLTSVKKAGQVWPGAQLHLVIGSDLIHQLPEWYRVEELLYLVKLLVIPRPGSPIDPEALGVLRQMGRVDIADMTAPDVSSTAYRQTRDSDAVPSSVEAYIHRQKLYA